jgi:hypothetical protein
MAARLSGASAEWQAARASIEHREAATPARIGDHHPVEQQRVTTRTAATITLISRLFLRFSCYAQGIESLLDPIVDLSREERFEKEERLCPTSTFLPPTWPIRLAMC